MYIYCNKVIKEICGNACDLAGFSMLALLRVTFSEKKINKKISFRHALRESVNQISGLHRFLVLSRTETYT